MTNPKTRLRISTKQHLRCIPLQRRKEASEKVLESLLPKIRHFTLVVSFASFGHEINLWPLNAQLEKQGSLCLPGHSLGLFKVESIADQLCSSSLKPLVPNPTLCVQVDLQQVDCILVPALLFDQNLFRIGHGGGFYDRLLEKVHPNTSVWGVGLLEQRSPCPLPREPHDIPVKKLFLF
ncbi:MAG: 5-formyltetrahydrofolate cyclo-ligase [Simkania sp.]|nr:5-formyltetrahydrofolate cyclo-ligase [Simkania sp.]